MTMCKRSMKVVIAVVGCWLAAAVALADPGAGPTITGTAVDAVTGKPIAGATVEASGVRATTRADGTYTLNGVAAGDVEVEVVAPGYEASRTRVTVAENAAATADVLLAPQNVGSEVIDIVVVTGSRAPEKRLDAPVTIESVGAQELQARGGTSYLTALADVKGIDYSQTGVNEQRISARGFTTQFNSRMLFMLDGHAAQLPGSGLPLGNMLPSPSLDIRSVEVVEGPASALYGPNAHTGVVNVITKSPWDDSGLTLQLRGGTQNMIAGSARVAGTVADRFGWKLNAEYLDANDFEPDRDAMTHYYGTSIFEKDLVGDYDVRSAKVDGSVYYQADAFQAKGTYGFSLTDGFSATNAGRNHLRDWQVHYQNLQLAGDSWFAQVTRTASDAGESYQINRLATMVQTMGGLPDDPAQLEALKDQIKFVDSSQLIDSEVQVHHDLWKLKGTAGLQHRLYLPDSAGTYLDDRDKSIKANEIGGYLQLELPVVSRVMLVGAGRVDHHTNYPTQVSPKGAVVVTVAPDHKVRAGYNRAFKSPTILENYLHIGDTLLGNRTGYEVRDGAGNVLSEIDPLVPEEVNAVEVGYKGVFAERLLVDVVAYNAWYKNFISPLTQVANPMAADPTFAFYPDGTPVAEGTAAQGTLFTYQNFGKAMVRGADVGVELHATRWLSLLSSASMMSLADFENKNMQVADLLLNVPEMKVKGAVQVRDLGGYNWFARVGGRWNSAYAFSSGYWDSQRLLGGDIPAHFVLDASAGYQFANGLSLTANVANALDDPKVDVLGAPVPQRFAYLQLGYNLDGLRY